MILDERESSIELRVLTKLEVRDCNESIAGVLSSMFNSDTLRPVAFLPSILNDLGEVEGEFEWRKTGTPDFEYL